MDGGVHISGVRLNRNTGGDCFVGHISDKRLCYGEASGECWNVLVLGISLPRLPGLHAAQRLSYWILKNASLTRYGEWTVEWPQIIAMAAAMLPGWFREHEKILTRINR